MKEEMPLPVCLWWSVLKTVWVSLWVSSNTARNQKENTLTQYPFLTLFEELICIVFETRTKGV